MKGKSSRVAIHFILFLIINAAWAKDAHAYLDPGTGSMLITAVLGLLATMVFLLKTLQYKIICLSDRLSS